MPQYHVRIIGDGNDAMADLVRIYHMAVFRHTVEEVDENRYRVDAYIDEDQIVRLEEVGYEIKRIADVEEVGRARQAEVGKGDEYRRYQHPKDSDVPE
jgi:hypothetical protein